MILIGEPAKNWFGFTRRERRSSFILLLMIIAVILLRYLVPGQNIKIEEWGSMPADSGNNIQRDNKTLTGYGSRGGKFKRPSDTRKLYGHDSSMAGKVKRYVTVPAEHFEGDAAVSQVKERPLLNINTCDSLSLVALPGIGPVLSARIIKYRYLLGGYASVGQLKEVYGLNEETFEMIRGRIYADSTGVRRVKINTAGYRELSHIPYLEKYDVSAILKYRQLTGRVKSLEDLKENKILLPEKADKAGAYMDFR